MKEVALSQFRGVLVLGRVPVMKMAVVMWQRTLWHLFGCYF
jgi:hypothetical protein